MAQPRGDDLDFRPWLWAIEKPIFDVSIRKVSLDGTDSVLMDESLPNLADSTDVTMARKLVIVQNPDSAEVVYWGVEAAKIWGRIEPETSVVLPIGPGVPIYLASGSKVAITDVVVIEMA